MQSDTAPDRTRPGSLAFAGAIAGRTDRIRLIDPTSGKFIRTSPWPSAEPTLPYATHIARPGLGFRTLALDLDAKVEGRAEAAARDAKIAVELLRDCGIRPVLAISGPSGGRHVLSTFKALIPEVTTFEIADRMKLVLMTLDISMLKNSATGCVRPPGSPHKSGGMSVIDQREHDWWEALAILQEGNDPETADRLLATLPPLPTPMPKDRPQAGSMSPELIPKLVRRLMEGSEDGSRYQSRSEVVQAVAMSLFDAGFEDDDAYEIAWSVPSVAERLEEESDPRTYFDRSWRVAESAPPSNPHLSDGARTAARIRERADADRLPPGPRKLLEAFVGIATRANETTINASHRTLAIEAGMSPPMIERHLPRILNRYLRRARIGRGRLGSSWTLIVEEPAAGSVILDPDPSSSPPEASAQTLYLRGFLSCIRTRFLRIHIVAI